MASGDPKIVVFRSERLLIAFFCIAAAFRIFIYSAAFPFFSNIDEDLHFDLITQYSHARLPRSFDRIKDETLNWVVPYASPEFLFSPERFPGGKFPSPLWKEPWAKVEPDVAATRAVWSGEVNFESSQPPLYYALASVWWWAGKHIGLKGIQSIYWIRFLNVPLIAVIVWLGYVAAREIAPEETTLRIGVPLLLAFLPQNVFYAMNNDVLSPICFGALFLCVLQWLRTNKPGFLLGVLTGLATAATYLAKLSNLPLIGMALVIVAARCFGFIRQKPRGGLITLAALILCAAIPIGSWMLWTKLHFGDFTGSIAKIGLLGWTRKPLGQWWQHPVFTPHGFWIFWSDLIASFWRGEVSWEGQPLRWRVTDLFYAVSSLLFVPAAIVGLRKQSGLTMFQRRAIGSAILIFVAGVVFLLLLSIQFDFGNCINPSRAHPYFTSGRLLTGALIPFAIGYVYGVIWLGSRVNSALPLIVLGSVVCFAMVSEIFVNRAVFVSEYNWFHL